MIRFENTNKRGHHERNTLCALRIPASRLFGKGETGIRARKCGDDSRKVGYGYKVKRSSFATGKKPYNILQGAVC